MKSINVFVNCPFDDEYKPIFEAVIFTIFACGYRPRCALEENDATNLRLNKIVKLIGDCSKSIHDLSRTQLSASGLPRFNMPFELGLMMGAKHFGGKRGEKKSALVMIEEQYALPRYISDLGGNDPSHHRGEVYKAIEIVRRYLHLRPQGGPSPGPKKIFESFEEFKLRVPDLMREEKLEIAEVDSIVDYPTFTYFMAYYLKNDPIY
jgi:hypothetical protein